MSQLRTLEQEWTERNVAIAVVSFEVGPIAAQYVADSRLPWPVLLDPQRTLYRAYGMDRAPWRKIWSLASLREYARLLRRGERMRRATGDTRQRGGDVLIDPDQYVRLLHVSDGPTDRPTARTLLAKIDTP